MKIYKNIFFKWARFSQEIKLKNIKNFNVKRFFLNF